MTYWYEVYGIRLRSDIELSFAKGIQVGEPDVDLISAPESFFSEISRDAVLKPTSYGWYKYALLDHDQIYLRWDGMFEFLVDGDGRRLWFEPAFSLFRRGQVRPAVSAYGNSLWWHSRPSGR